MKYCPQCGITLRGDTCPCGWAAKKADTQHDPDRHRCAYTANGQRCTLPGSCTNSIHGADKWYCRFHLHALNEKDAAYGRQILADLIANPPKRETPWYDQAREDWERKHKSAVPTANNG